MLLGLIGIAKLFLPHYLLLPRLHMAAWSPLAYDDCLLSFAGIVGVDP